MPKGFNCAACGSSDLKPFAGGRWVCEHCGTAHAAPDRLCPECGQVNAEGSALCAKCGEPLAYVCRACGQGNWSGAEVCAGCGRPLDMLEVVARSAAVELRERLEEQRRNAAALKADEARASEERLERLWAVERERQRRLTEAAARQAARDRATLQVIAIGGVALLVLVVIAAAALRLR